MFTLNLNSESAAVLLRCLGYGQAAISQQESKNGVGKLIEENIELLRKHIVKGLADDIINELSEENRRAKTNYAKG